MNKSGMISGKGAVKRLRTFLAIKDNDCGEKVKGLPQAIRLAISNFEARDKIVKEIEALDGRAGKQKYIKIIDKYLTH